jgi:uncharacterized repeat protein (TIGR01451 family)
MRRRGVAVASAIASALVAISPILNIAGGAVSAAPGNGNAFGHSGVSQPVKAHVYNGKLSDLPTITKHRGPSKGSADEGDLDGGSTDLSNGPRDPLLPPAPGNLPTSTGAMTPPIANFAGLGNVDGKIPPDTHGDVGLTDYLQVVNISFDVYSKATGAELIGGPKNTNSLWTAAAPGTTCALYNDGDAIARYDASANRFVLTQFAFKVSGAGPSDECFAISQTGDPTAPGWFVYDFQVSATKWDDYPKISIWPDGYYATFNWGGGSGGGGAFSFDRANMLNGNPATFQCFGCDGDSYANLGSDPQLLFADWDSTTPPAFGAPETFTRFVAPNTLKSWAMHVDWQSPLNTTLTALPDITVANFTPVGGIQQPTPNGTTQATNCYNGTTTPNPCPAIPASPNLESVSDRLMSRLQYRNFGSYETEVVNHSVDVGGGQSGIRWYELRRGGTYGANWQLYQQGTYAPDTDSRWMGSIAMDQAGDIAVGYSISSTTTFPSIRAAGRLPGDPLGLLPQGEVSIAVGGGAQDFGWDGSGRRRWGDYSAMNIDPVDGCTFWYTQEYIQSPTYTNAGIANWNTQIASFRFPSCNPADVGITASATPSPVLAGGELRYQLSAFNNGPSTANNVVVKDTLPTGVSFITSTVACSEAAQVLSCPLGSMISGQSTPIEIRTTVDPAQDVVSGGPSSITDTATISATELDPDTTNNSATVATVVNESADLAVSKTCDATLAAGAAGKCTIIIDNNGPSSARAVVLTDAATSNGTFTMSSATPSSGSCSISGSPGSSVTATCNLGVRAAGAAGRDTIVVSYTATDGQTISDTATTTSATPDAASGNNAATASLPITSVADLEITADTASPSPAIAGQNLTFSVTARNNGPSTAKTVVLQDALPAGVTVSNVTAPGATACNVGTPGDASHPTTCGFDVLASGASRTMTIVTTVLPQTLGNLHSDASVSSATFDPDNSNNLAHTDTAVGTFAEVGLTMGASPSPVIAGQALTYNATIANTGTSTARTLTLFETLPAGVTFVGTSISNGSSGTCAQVVGHPDQIQCQLNDLDPGKSLTVYTQVTVNAATAKLTVLTINGNATTSSTDPTTPDTASASATVDTRADLGDTLTAPSHVYQASTTVTYTSTVSNAGPSDAQTVTLTVNMPGTKVGHYVSNNAPAGVCTFTATSSATTVTCHFGVLAAGANTSVQIVYFIQGNAKSQTVTESVASTTTDPVAANNSATWTVGPK